MDDTGKIGVTTRPDGQRRATTVSRSTRRIRRAWRACSAALVAIVAVLGVTVSPATTTAAGDIVGEWSVAISGDFNTSLTWTIASDGPGAYTVAVSGQVSVSTLSATLTADAFHATGGSNVAGFFTFDGTLEPAGSSMSGTWSAVGITQTGAVLSFNGTWTATKVVSDSQPPLASPAQTPVPTPAGWNNGPVTVAWNWSDEPGGSGIDPAACTTSSVASGDGNQQVSASCRDLAGNSTTAVWNVSIDRDPPTNVIGTPSRPADAGGFYNHPVDIGFSGGDALSGIESCTTVNYSGPDSRSAVANGACTDNAGNTTAGRSTLAYDATAPTVTFTGNREYTVDQTVKLVCLAADNLAGVRSTDCRKVTVDAWSLGLGAHTYTAVATDKAANTGSGSATVTVRVTFDSLCTLTTRFVSDHKNAKALCSQLAAAKAAAARGNTKAKDGALNAYRQLLAAGDCRGVPRDRVQLLMALSKQL